jgi:hypothetical protein
LREAARVAGVHFKKSMWCLRYETGEMTGRDHYHCLLSVLGSQWVQLATCFYLMDYWEKKLGCGHARVRLFDPAEEEEGNNGGWLVGEPLGGAAYTCKDLAESLAGKDRYEFEKFFASRTMLTLSDSSLREVHGATGTIHWPLHRHAPTGSRVERRHPATLGPRTSPGEGNTSRVPCLARLRAGWVA